MAYSFLVDCQLLLLHELETGIRGTYYDLNNIDLSMWFDGRKKRTKPAKEESISDY